MGTAGLIQIRRRMKSVESTRKITKAMALVATSKFRKVRKRLNYALEYNEMTRDILDRITSMMPEETESIFIDKKDDSFKLYIVIFSNMGLCGGFNNNIGMYLKSNLNSEDKIVCIGSMGSSYLKKYGFSSVKEFEGVNDIPTSEDINNIYNYIKDMYEDKVSEIKIIYTEFISPIKQNVREVELLPIKREYDSKVDCIVEPDIESVFYNSVELYLKSELMKCMVSSKVSEHSSRRVAMESATESADDIIKSLNIKYNRIRQGIITQEISEIVGGAEAQK